MMNNFPLRLLKYNNHTLLVNKSRFWLSNKTEHDQFYDIVVIGGGIIGTAIAKTLLTNASLKRPEMTKPKIILIEKESELGQHQSGHNSGVIHSGLYYPSKSLKAQLCIAGVPLIYQYCRDNHIPHKQCGKLIIATKSASICDLYRLYYRGCENNVRGLEILRPDQFKEIQPGCSKGLRALWSPSTGNVNWQRVTQSFAQDFLQNGGLIWRAHRALKMSQSVLIESATTHPITVDVSTSAQSIVRKIQTKFVVICTGGAQLITSLTTNNNKAISFRIKYSRLIDPKSVDLIKTNLYAMPNLPFLGVHFSPTPDGTTVLLGPKAIPSFNQTQSCNNTIDMTYVRDVLSYSGFHRMLLTRMPDCIDQLTKSLCNRVLIDELAELWPPLIRMTGSISGVDPDAVQVQYVDSNGSFGDDYAIEMFSGDGVVQRRTIDCRVITSPGATSALAIADMVAGAVDKVYY